MTFHAPVPSDVEPTSFIDLANDCREVASVLGHSVIDLTAATLAGVTRAARVPLARVPLDRLPMDRLPFSFGAMPVEITDDLLVTVSGMDDY